ncbi:MAG: rRNA maturation RNase YbeY [Anaerolineales bacterium]|jgi:probable rRNA maturation factor
MIYIDVHPGLKTRLVSDLLEGAARATLRQQSVPEADLTLVLAGDARLRTLNREYLEQDVTTDVLSFPSMETDPDTGRRYLGDVVISLPRAESQARAGKHPLEQEVQLLVVHGVLHLLGHDHAEAEDKKRMWTAQAEILKSLGVPSTIIHE